MGPIIKLSTRNMLKNKLSKALILPVMTIVGFGAGIAGMASAQSATTAADTSTVTPVAAVTTGAATTVTPTATPAAATTQPAFDPAKGGHVGANGVKEELLTGDSAAKATAAALAA